MADSRITDWRGDGSGNIWRVWKGRMVILFRDPDGRWHWSVADGRRIKLSKEHFGTEGEATAALGAALGEAEGS